MAFVKNMMIAATIAATIGVGSNPAHALSFDFNSASAAGSVLAIPPVKQVPEPASIIGLLTVGALAASATQKRKL